MDFTNFCNNFQKNVITASKKVFRVSGVFPACFGFSLPSDTAGKNTLSYRSVTKPYRCSIQCQHSRLDTETCSLRDRDWQKGMLRWVSIPRTSLETPPLVPCDEFVFWLNFMVKETCKIRSKLQKRSELVTISQCCWMSVNTFWLPVTQSYRFVIIGLVQLCPTHVAYWAKNYVTILTRAAHWMTYFDLSKLNLA